ncbi:ectonucleoside triphosphate diphosphohydrolase 7-like [Hemitrygon akajei]|uniref:ectonucleoside triphosphate diphosphohydrolase 7-like n=1 Tax=Hemitrygon akajei TaxID=2704970 RepID=UPI003BFA0A1B
MVAVEGKSHWNSNVLHLFSQQNAILQNLYVNVPVEFDFLFSESHAEVISGKQEGDDALVAVTVSSNQGSVIRKRTVGILDMGGASLQIAYEVTNPVVFDSLKQALTVQ